MALNGNMKALIHLLKKEEPKNSSLAWEGSHGFTHYKPLDRRGLSLEMNGICRKSISRYGNKNPNGRIRVEGRKLIAGSAFSFLQLM